jgi:hypothetical protein
MPPIKKFTFKYHRPTGRYRSFKTEYHDIKFKGKICGSISESNNWTLANRDERISIKFMVKSNEEKCGWKWITLAAKFSNTWNAKEFLNRNVEVFFKKYDLFFITDVV